MASCAKIIIAESNPVVRAGLSDYLSKDGRFTVVKTVDDTNAFVAACEEAGKVDIGILSWGLPATVIADVLLVMKRRKMETRIIIYANGTKPDALRTAARSGAWGFVSTLDDPEILLDTISIVARGRLCFPYLDIVTIAHDPLEALTVRERQLLTALANGLTNEQIATRIGISRNTVKYHLKNVYDKLGVTNRAMAVALFAGISPDNGHYP